MGIIIFILGLQNQLWMGLKTCGWSCVCAHITQHTRKITSHSSKKSSALWRMIIDDSAPTHERRKLAKTYKYVLPQKRTVAAEVCGETYLKK